MTQNAIAALIHDRLGQTLSGVFAERRGVLSRDANPLSLSGKSLLEQLRDPGEKTPRITLGVVLSIIPDLSLNLPAGGDLRQAVVSRFQRLHQNLGAVPKRFRQHLDDLVALAAAQDPEAIRSAREGVFNGIAERWSRIKALVTGDDIGTILPLATIANAAPDLDAIPEEVERALLEYFFRADGYQTVDQESIVAPVHVANLVASARAEVFGPTGDSTAAAPVKGLLVRATGEQYIRDITRVIVESAYDTVRGLRDSYGKVGDELKLNPGNSDARTVQNKFGTWFRGCSSMAESAAMRAVETGAQGVSQLQTNPLIAAAAGSFAGTVARKLAQDAFLGILRKDLGLRED